MPANAYENDRPGADLHRYGDLPTGVSESRGAGGMSISHWGMFDIDKRVIPADLNLSIFYVSDYYRACQELAWGFY
jgi:hypothetical protein